MPLLKITLKPSADPKAVKRQVTVTAAGGTTTIDVAPGTTLMDPVPFTVGDTPHVIVHDFNSSGVRAMSPAVGIPVDLAPPATPEAPTVEVLPDPPATASPPPQPPTS
jgi:hypothetical protein